MKEKIGFIINPVAGTKNKDKIPHLVDKYLDKNRFEPHLFYTERVGHGTEIAYQLSIEGFPYVVAVGGDGTVNEIGRGIIHTNAALGIIPLGSGNGLARHLKIPMNARKAIEYLNTAQVVDVDYGKANDNIFFCVCGVGFDAHISRQFALADKRGLKTYAEKVIKEYFTYKPQKYWIKSDTINIEREAFLITFANASQYGNNAYIAPHASMQDGMMDICILSKFPLVNAPVLAFKLFTKHIDKSRFMLSLRANKITLQRKQAGAFHFDGEASEAGIEIEISIVPNGLKMLIQ